VIRDLFSNHQQHRGNDKAGRLVDRCHSGIRNGGKMDTDLQRTANLIGPDAMLRLRDVRGHSILDVSGRLWITQQGDARDIFLDVGERFAFDRDGEALVQAIGPRAAVAVIEAPAPASAPGLAAAAGWRAVQARSALVHAWDRLRPRPASAACAGCAS
jgi:hypothetical protein